MEYLVVFFIVSLLAVNNKRLDNQTRVYWISIICVYIVLLMGLRYRVGIDTINYLHSYNKTPSLDSFFENDFTETRFEPGYLLLCALCRTVTKDFWLLQLFQALILNVCVFIFIYRNARNPFVGILIYFFLAWLYFNTEIMRESLAIAIFLLNYENLRRQRWIRYYLLCALSISFQYSAVILLLFPLVRYIRLNVWYIAVGIALLMIMPWAERFSQLITITSVAKRVTQYVTSADELNLNWRIGNMLRSLICPVVAMIIFYRTHERTKFDSFILLHILFGIGAFSIPIIFSRFSNYTLLFVVVYVANLLVKLKRNSLLRYAFVFLLFVSQINYYYRMFWCWYPYESIFTMRKIPEREQLWYDFNRK